MSILLSWGSLISL